MGAPVEVTVVRLYTKSPGSAQLRKNAAAELAQLLAAGWQETKRSAGADHVVLRLERRRPAKPCLPPGPGQGARGANGRPQAESERRRHA